MGRGNTCVHNDYEGLYYVDKDFICSYYLDEDEEQTLILGVDREYSKIDDYIFDEDYTEQNYYDFVSMFKKDMIKMFDSFEDTNNRYGVILENKLFSIVIEDNEWSYAIKLIQKENDYYDTYCIENLQKRHYLNYLKGIKSCLFNQFNEIGGYAGPWTHSILKKDNE